MAFMHEANITREVICFKAKQTTKMNNIEIKRREYYINSNVLSGFRFIIIKKTHKTNKLESVL